MDQPRYVTLAIDGVTCDEVLALRATEAVSTLFRYELEVEVRPPMPDFAALIGGHASVTIRDAGKEGRLVTGIVEQAQLLARDTGDIIRGKFVIRPAVYRQALGRDCWASQDLDVVAVIKDVLADYPHTVRYETTGAYPKVPYRVQYREDDWTYVSRIAEEEGIYYWFDHGGGESQIVFSDESKNAPEIDGVPALPYAPASGMRPDESAVLAVSFCAKAASHAFSARSFDMKRPGFQVAASVGSGRHEVYDAPGGNTPSPEVLSARTRVGHEAANAARAGISGIATCVRLLPGRTFTIFGHPVAELNGRFFITAVDLTADPKVGVTSRFKAIPVETPFRAPRVTKEAKQAGLQMGVVVGPDGQEVHPDEYGRIRVQMHWDRLGARNETAGTWCRIAQRATPGSLLTPRMGWNVATFNEEGGVDAPSTLCRIHDGDHPPEYELPANMTRVVYKTATTPRTGTYNEIYFEDKRGQEEMFIHASQDFHNRVLNDHNEDIRNNSLRDIGNNLVLHVDDGMVAKVIQDQKVDIDGNEELVVQGMYTKGVAGNETRQISGDRTLAVNESHTTTVDANRELQVEGSLTEISLGTIASTSAHAKTTIAGSLTRVAGATITEDVTKLAMQRVGGSRVEIAEVNQPTDVQKILDESAGEGMFLVSNAKYLDNADTTSSWTVTESLVADAPRVWAEAEEKIVVRCGSSILTLTKDVIEIESTNIDLSGANMDAQTATLKHNT